MKSERLLPWLLVLPALVFLTSLSPIAGDPYPHLAATGWAALALVPLGLVFLLRARAPCRLAWPFVGVLAWALLSHALVPLTDTFEARRALIGLALVPLALATGGALDARGRRVLEWLCVLTSAGWTAGALWTGAAEEHLAGVLGDTGSLSQAALAGAAIGAVWLVRADGARRWLGGIALALFLVHVAAAPVLAGAHTLLAGLLLALALNRGPRRAALAALAGGALLAPFVGIAVRQASGSAPAVVEGASASPSHSLGGLGVRGRIWVASVGLVRAHPVLGAGPGQFQAAFPPHRDAREIERSRHGICSELDTEVEHAHNDWLQSLCELGIPGGLLLVLGLVLVARAALRALRDDERLATAVAALALLVNAFVHAPLSANPASAVLGCALFGTLAVPGTRRRPGLDRSATFAVAVPALAAAFFALPLIGHGRALTDFVAASRDLAYLQFPAELRVPAMGRASAEAITRALEEAPDSAPARLLAAREAREPERFDAVLEIRPHSVEAWERSATAHARLAHLAEARERYAHALELSPTHPRILRNLARLELLHGELERGLATLERLRASGCLPEAWLASLANELVLVLGQPERGARVREGRALAELSPEELHARSREAREPPAAPPELLADYAQHGPAADECLAQLLWARQHAAAGDFEAALRNYRQVTGRSLQVRGRLSGPAPLYALEQAAAEVRGGREAEARALLSDVPRESLDGRSAELPSWAVAALGELGWKDAP